MKKFIIVKYYGFLMFLEIVFGEILDRINHHRQKVDKKYWEKYLSC